jgi:putative intracellular protease/amidase
LQIAIVLYPGFTSLDGIGPYEVWGRLTDSEVVFVTEQPGQIVNDLRSLSVNVNAGSSRTRGARDPSHTSSLCRAQTWHTS